MCKQCEEDAVTAAIELIKRNAHWNEASQSFIVKADPLYGCELGRKILKILRG